MKIFQLFFQISFCSRFFRTPIIPRVGQFLYTKKVKRKLDDVKKKAFDLNEWELSKDWDGNFIFSYDGDSDFLDYEFLDGKLNLLVNLLNSGILSDL